MAYVDARRERLLAEPAHHGVDVLADRRRVVRAADHVAAADVDLVGEADRDAHRRGGLVDRATELVDRRDRRAEAGRQHQDLVAGAELAAGHLPGVAPVVVVLVRHGPDDVLDREPRVDQVAVRPDVEVLEVPQQRGPAVPRRVRRVLDDVVAEQGRDRDERQVGELELAGELGELGADLLEDLLVEVDEVHLVDAHREVLDLQQRGDDGVTPALLGHALAGVDEHEREVGGRGAGHHVPRVLHVARGVGDDELALGRGEVAVGDVDRDALLPLGPQAVGEEREVGVVEPLVPAGALDGLQLVLEDLLRVEEQAPDQGRLAVVDGARRGESQHLHQK